MKSKFSLPPGLRSLSYRVVPSRVDVRRTFEELEQGAISYDDTQQRISAALRGQQGFSIARPGGTESEGVKRFLEGRVTKSKPQSYSRFFLEHATKFSGIQYRHECDLDAFLFQYVRGVLDADMLAYGMFAPGALPLVRTCAAMGIPVTNFQNLEPWQAYISGTPPWTEALKGLEVLVVHPFVDSIKSNFERKKSISVIRDILPDFNLKVEKPPVTLHKGGPDDYWLKSFEGLKEGVESHSFDVAIIGAGAYGLPLARHVGEMGKVAINLAGATQLLFGIKGIRWASGYSVSSLIDGSWSSPLDQDLSPEIYGIDGGSYH